jgi:hypothetical protein
MSPPRRGRPSPPELRGTLGTLLRTTLAQANAVREALERGAREGRARFDDVRHERRRQEALAELGERVLERARRGELGELEELPDIAEALAHLEDLDSRDQPEPARRAREWVAPPSHERSRFDRRSSALDDGTVSSADWKPVLSRVEGAPAPRPPKEPPKRGGITFAQDGDDDDDLADYMHPDDVPPKK